MPNAEEIRAALLTEVSTLSTSPQSGSVLEPAIRRLNAGRSLELQQAILAQFNELFRTGYLAWGLDFSNPSPPFFHVTDQGRRALANFSRDPVNSAGYLQYLYSVASLNNIARSYLEEGLKCYNSDLYKAGAVMIGAAAESQLLELRDQLVNKLTTLGHPVPTLLKDWRIKKVTDTLKNFFDNKKNGFNDALLQEYESYWMAFISQIRSVRNEAGHPTSVAPITHEAVHASLLIFPELTKLIKKLSDWIQNDLT